MKTNLIIKRLFDLLASLSGLIIMSPFMLALSFVIKFTSPGPVLFKQERLGQYGQSFYIFKFRTMIENAEKMGAGLVVNDQQDQRITKIGRMLRSTSLDELPQLFNVIIGDMSLIGPRPPAIYHPYAGYSSYPEWAKKRFTMKPGMTGLTQITVRNAVSWDERLKIDNQYIDEFSLKQDLVILAKTFHRVIKPNTIY